MLQASPSDCLSTDHQVYILLNLVDELDLTAIVIPAQNNDPRGEKGFDPRMLTLLLLYASCAGVVSSHKIERACYGGILHSGCSPITSSRTTAGSVSSTDATSRLSGLFVPILRFCQDAGMASFGHVALDFIKVQANASNHKA